MIMSKPTLVYATILAACAAGLWVIHRAGSDLTAVANLSGEWRIESGPLGPSRGGPERLGDSFVFDQSGRFFRVRFSGGRVMDLKATTAPRGRLGDEPAAFELTGGQQRLAATIRRDGDRLAGAFVLTGPDAAEFVAHRVSGGGGKPAPPAQPSPPQPAGPSTRPIGPPAADLPDD